MKLELSIGVLGVDIFIVRFYRGPQLFNNNLSLIKTHLNGRDQNMKTRRTVYVKDDNNKNKHYKICYHAL